MTCCALVVWIETHCALFFCILFIYFYFWFLELEDWKTLFILVIKLIAWIVHCGSSSAHLLSWYVTLRHWQTLRRYDATALHRLYTNLSAIGLAVCHHSHRLRLPEYHLPPYFQLPTFCFLSLLAFVLYSVPLLSCPDLITKQLCFNCLTALRKLAKPFELVHCWRFASQWTARHTFDRFREIKM